MFSFRILQYSHLCDWSYSATTDFRFRHFCFACNGHPDNANLGRMFIFDRLTNVWNIHGRRLLANYLHDRGVAYHVYVAQRPCRNFATQWIPRCDADRNKKYASGLVFHRRKRYSKRPKSSEIGQGCTLQSTLPTPQIASPLHHHLRDSRRPGKKLRMEN